MPPAPGCALLSRGRRALELLLPDHKHYQAAAFARYAPGADPADVERLNSRPRSWIPLLLADERCWTRLDVWGGFRGPSAFVGRSHACLLAAKDELEFLSRFAWNRQAGSAAVMSTDITASMTSRAAMAYPCWPRVPGWPY